MNTLIVKLNATGDVVRTTALVHKLEGSITWITARSNVPLLTGLTRPLRCLAWEQRDEALTAEYDLAINLEDDVEPAAFVARTRSARVFGAVLEAGNRVGYSDDSHVWFDMSLVSRLGRARADELKLRNRSSYQQMLFAGLGHRFEGEPYVLPSPPETGLRGDVAIAPVAGPVWPMKNWHHYDELQRRLEARGLRVNVLPRRDSLLEHLGDVAAHRCLVSGDSLPMHLALGAAVPCVTLFNCTSPWEIHDYGLQTQLISPLLEQFFYQRGTDEAATTAISVETVEQAVMQQLDRASGRRNEADGK